MPLHFQKNDAVEVLRSPNLYLPATVLGLPSPKHRDKVYVQLETLNSRDREYVNVCEVRPVPPVELHRYFMAGEAVDAFVEGVGWRSGGKIEDILENSKYRVSFGEKEGEEVVEEIDQMNVRIHRDWDHGSWIPPFQFQVYTFIKFIIYISLKKNVLFLVLCGCVELSYNKKCTISVLV